MKSSIVEAFATFLLLSYVKLLSVSFDLLVHTHVYQVNGSLVRGNIPILYDATIEYFGDKHLPYAVLTVYHACHHPLSYITSAPIPNSLLSMVSRLL